MWLMGKGMLVPRQSQSDPKKFPAINVENLKTTIRDLRNSAKSSHDHSGSVLQGRHGVVQLPGKLFAIGRFLFKFTETNVGMDRSFADEVGQMRKKE